MPSRWWNRLQPRTSAPPRRRAARHSRPEVELLEDRCVPSTLVGLSTNNQLLAFDSQSPGTIQAALPITDLPSGELILDIDFRPTTGQLYV